MNNIKKQQPVTKSRRFGAYFLDGMIILIIGQLLISFLKPKGLTESAMLDEPSVVFLLSVLSIALKFGYYIYFWNVERFGSTLGQFVFNLKIERTATLKQCLKRLLLMNISGIYLSLAMQYMSFSNLSGDMQDYFMIVAMLSATIMQLIYAYYIEKVDKITGIKVVVR